MQCTQCGANLPDKAKFCPECGGRADIAPAKCDACGSALKASAKFCHSCGKPRPEEKKEVSAPVPQNRNVFATLGVVLVIPVVAIGIITLLFWKNQDPAPVQASNPANSQSAPTMAAMGAVHETLDRLKKNIESNPKDLVSLDSLAIMYSIAGSYDKASKYYEQHLAIEPENKDVKIALGLTYNNLKRTDEAIALMQEVLQKEPDYAFALFYLGEIYASAGQLDLAKTNWNRIVEKYPNMEIAKMAEQRIHELTHVDGGSSN